MLKNYLTLGDAKIEVRYVEGEQRFAAEAFAVLDKALPGITAYFDLADPFPKVRVILVANRAEFDHLVRDLLRVEIEAPSHPARIAQPQRTDLVALSPSAYLSYSTFEHVPDQFDRLLSQWQAETTNPSNRIAAHGVDDRFGAQWRITE